MNIISSSENRIVKEAASLAEKKYRDRTGLFLVEGPNLVKEAMLLGNRVRFIFTRAGAADAEAAELAEEAQRAGLAVYVLTEGIFDKVAQTRTPQGICAVLEKKSCAPGEFFEKAGNGCVLVLDRLQDPGNVGTLLRSAEAMDFAGAVFIKGTADPWQPKVVRAAAGSLLRLPILQCEDARQALSLLAGAGKQVFTAVMEAELACWNAPLSENAAIVIGNEGAGAGEQLKAAATLVSIPMAGHTESLNAAVAGSMLMYESYRQKGQKL